MIYFDACYIAKFYLAEPDSANVIAFTAGNSRVSCLLTGKAEVIAVFHRKFRECIVDVSGFHLLCDQFEADCASGLWQWHPVGDTLLRLAAQRFRALPSTTFLRAADALHLTCAAEEGFVAIHTSDRHMIAAAPAFGLRTVTL
ncbi:MAG TPA: type II toxin-antitoxin system VapC family toxin [Verrucomicrobiales bacterium]|nr:type II toxin-antitoxin system VapC family toxin [Verrucomicrobiales bacterium]